MRERDAAERLQRGEAEDGVNLVLLRRITDLQILIIKDDDGDIADARIAQPELRNDSRLQGARPASDTGADTGGAGERVNPSRFARLRVTTD